MNSSQHGPKNNTPIIERNNAGLTCCDSTRYGEAATRLKGDAVVVSDWRSVTALGCVSVISALALENGSQLGSASSLLLLQIWVR